MGVGDGSCEDEALLWEAARLRLWEDIVVCVYVRLNEMGWMYALV